MIRDERISETAYALLYVTGSELLFWAYKQASKKVVRGRIEP